MSLEGKKAKDFDNEYYYLHLECGVHKAWKQKPVSGFTKLKGEGC